MSALCGDGREVNCSAEGRGSDSDAGMEIGPRGVVFVGPLSINSVMSVLTDLGVTFSTMTKAGRRRTVVGSVYLVEWDGVGIFDAESINFFFWRIVLATMNKIFTQDPHLLHCWASHQPSSQLPP